MALYALLLTGILILVPGATLSGTAIAGEWAFSGSAAGELRLFPEAPAFPEQDDARLSPSVSFEPKIVYEWNDGRDRLTLVPFVRLDAHDDHRTHGDLREANWLHLGDGWDLVVGLDKVFWGVAESRHLVDIINQDDRVEDIDGEDKLGQPMINLNLLSQWGRVSLFVLPGFRERTFPARDARLRGLSRIVDATFDSRAKTRHIDVAVRWAHSTGNWDMGVAHFHGTSREPRLMSRMASDGETVLVPHYDQIDQTSLDVQLTKGAWLWKLEAMTRSGHGDRFLAAVGGFEYTLFNLLGTGLDLGLLAEYLYDGRHENRAPATVFDNDIFLGARLALNDIQDTSALVGAVIDHHSGATAGVVEAERRIGDRWKIELESRLFLNVPDGDPLSGFRQDHVITLRLSTFF